VTPNRTSRERVLPALSSRGEPFGGFGRTSGTVGAEHVGVVQPGDGRVHRERDHPGLRGGNGAADLHHWSGFDMRRSNQYDLDCNFQRHHRHHHHGVSATDRADHG